MTDPTTESPADKRPSFFRGVIWIAIGALIAAAIVSVVWILVGSQDAVFGRAFLTILLLAGFAGAALFDANEAPKRPAWYQVASMVGWVVILLCGAVKIWMPAQASWWVGDGIPFFEFVGILLIVRLALLHFRLYLRAHERYVTTFTQIVAIVTVVLVSALAVMLIIPLVFGEWYNDQYWRVVASLTILAAVGTALVPLMNALNAPKKPKPANPFAASGGGYAASVPPAGAYAQAGLPAAPPAAPRQQWPTYVDGVTPLPALPDGTPDLQAYYTGFPTAPVRPAVPAAPVAPAATVAGAEAAQPVPAAAEAPVSDPAEQAQTQPDEEQPQPPQ